MLQRLLRQTLALSGENVGLCKPVVFGNKTKAESVFTGTLPAHEIITAEYHRVSISLYVGMAWTHMYWPYKLSQPKASKVPLTTAC